MYTLYIVHYILYKFTACTNIRIDIMNIGTVLYTRALFVSVRRECLGRVMFQNRSTGYAVVIHGETDSPFLRAIKDIIQPMIALNQSDRPSISEVVDSLSHLLDSPPDLDPILMIDSCLKNQCG